MGVARTRYELRVETVVSDAALATFRVPLRPTAVPRNTVYRFRVPADRDLSDLLSLLTERAVQVLEIRQCTEPEPRDRTTARGEPETPTPGTVLECPPDPRGVVVPFPGRAGRHIPAADPPGGHPAG